MRTEKPKTWIAKTALAGLLVSVSFLLLSQFSGLGNQKSIPKRVGPRVDWEKNDTDPVPKIGKPIAKFPVNVDPLNKDPLYQLNAPKRLKGTLLYGQAPYRTGEELAYWSKREKEKDFVANEWDVGYNAIVHLGVRTLDEGVNSTTAYPMEINGGQYIMGAEFFKDGRRVLLKMGWPFDQSGTFSVFVVDLPAQKAKRVARFLSFREVLLSPDESFIAFVRGGTAMGDNSGRLKPLTLCTVNLQTGKEQVVIEDDSVTAGGWAWTPRNTLLFSVLKPNPEAAKSPSSAAKKPARTSLVPTLYEVPAAGGQPALLLRDAWKPVPSPDGKHLAFFGSEDPLQPESLSSYWQENPQGASLCIAERDGSGRKALNREQGSYPKVLWKSDSKHLLSLKTVSVENRNTLFAVEFDVETGKMRPLTRMVSRDDQALPRPQTVLPPFKPLQLSNDEKYLFAISESLGKMEPKTGLMTGYTTLLEINLENGEALAIAKLKNAWGIDWHDQSTSASAPSTPPVP